MSSINGLGQKNGYPNTLTEDRGKTGRTKGDQSAAGNSAISGSGDSLQLSQGVADMQQLTKSLAAEPSFDQAKVDRIKTMIENGEYAIDATKIAERFRAIESGSN